MKTNVTFDSAGLKIAGHLYTPGDGATYSDADMASRLVDGKWVFTHKDGSPYT